MDDSDFYEDDEPLGKIQAIRRRVPDFVTRRRVSRGVTLYLGSSPTTGKWERTAAAVTNDGSAGGQAMMTTEHRPMSATMQTAEPLVELRTQSTARPLSWFEQLADGDETELDVDQPYQRGDVWDDNRRRLLIRSLMQGVPIGAITVNNRFTAKFHEPAYWPVRTGANRNWAFAIIDGKQRVTAVVRWLRSELTVPASWFPASEILCQEDTVDGPHVRLNGLEVRQGRHFRNTPVSVVEATVRTLADERTIFDLINFGGVPQGETD